MKVYIASSIKNKNKVKNVFEEFRANGHKITTDWTYDLPEKKRSAKKDYLQLLAKRDFEGIRECDVFVLLSKPSEGRSMYAELGLALAMKEVTGKPAVFVVGPNNNESIFYFHPAVRCVDSLDKVLIQIGQENNDKTMLMNHEGKIEEYKALRNEMLEIIKERVWGQTTYVGLVAGLLILMDKKHMVESLVFLIAIAIPFLFHIIQREEARTRMGNYLRAVLEPQISGMGWEKYLGIWRKKNRNKGLLRMAKRFKHVFAFSGVYLLTAIFCWLLLCFANAGNILFWIGTVLTIVNVIMFCVLYRVDGKGEKENKELLEQN